MEVSRLEQLAEALYTQASSEAERELRGYVHPSSPQVLVEVQQLMTASNNPYAHMLGLRSISEVVVRHWKDMGEEVHVSLKNYLMEFIGNRCPQLGDFVIKEVIKLLCVVVKRGWFEREEMREMPLQASRFLMAESEVYSIMGLRLLRQLVQGMSGYQFVPQLTRVMHRRTLIAFRDEHLQNVFVLALSSLRELMSVTGRSPLKEAAVDLAHACLMFDFVGSVQSEVADVGSVMYPISWRPLFDEPLTLDIFFGTYFKNEAPVSNVALECIVQLAAARSTAFTSTANMSVFLGQLLGFLQTVLDDSIGIFDLENHHHICRLLSRLKTTYQLSMFMRAPNYAGFIQSVASFTVKTFQAWKWASHGIYYMLHFWSQCMTSVAFGVSGHTYFSELVPDIFEAYVQSRLEAIRYSYEDPQYDVIMDETIADDLELLFGLARLEYSKSSAFVLHQFDTLAAKVNAAAEQGGGALQQLESQVALSQLAVMVYFLACLISGRISMLHSDVYDQVDGTVALRVFQLMTACESWGSGSEGPQANAVGGSSSGSSSGGGGGKAMVHLELSILYFLLQFRHMFYADSQTRFLSVFDVLGSAVNIHSPTQVLVIIAAKYVVNFKKPRLHELVLKKTLSGFHDMFYSYSTNHMMNQLDVIPQLLTHHSAEHFSFLSSSDLTYQRTTFYVTLGKLLLVEKFSGYFEPFMEPFERTLAFLSAAPSVDVLRTPQYEQLLVGLLRDLRGVFHAFCLKSMYLRLFEWLYHGHLPLFLRVSDAFLDRPQVMSPLLKFWNEVTSNTAKRVMFGPTSTNGLSLFKNLADLMVRCGSFLVGVDDRTTAAVYEMKYKPIMLCLTLLTTLLTGGYVPLSAFAYYQDPVLSNLLQLYLKIMLTVPSQSLAVYPKLKKAYYSFLHAVFKSHMDEVLALDGPSLLHILSFVKFGLLNNEEATVNLSALALLKFASFYLKPGKASALKACPNGEMHRSVLAQTAPEFIELIFSLLPTMDNIWGVSQPLLGFILLFPQAYANYCQATLDCATRPELRETYSKAFNSLMLQVTTEFTVSNRQRFYHNLSAYRSTLTI